MSKKTAIFSFVVISFISNAFAYDPKPLQDFCVATTTTSVKVNGFACKDPKEVTAEDFFYSGLNIAGNSTNAVGSYVTHVFVDALPGLNTLGVGIARIDFKPFGVNTLHMHPRATEILTVMEGSLEVGFVTSNPENRLFTKILQKGDVFVFPIGLIHYQRNVRDGHAVAIATLGSQSPGVIIVRDTVFGSKPVISGEILARSFQVDKSTVDAIQY